MALLTGVASAVPLWVGRFVPLLDLPQHLAVVAVLRHRADPAWGFAPFFEVEWGEFTPYWTHYLAVWVLSLLVSIETASRLYLTGYALAFPWAGIVLCRAFGRSPWLGLLAAPLAFNTNLYLGFVSYCTAVLLLLGLLAVFERGLARSTRRAAPTLVFGAALLFFTHVQVFVFLVMAALALAITRAGLTWRGRLLSLLPLAPATLGLLLPWAYQQLLASRAGGRYTFGRPGRLRASFQSPAEAVGDLPDAMAGAFQDGSDALILAGWAGLVVLAARGAASRRHRALLPAALALGAYFLAPMSIAGQWNIGPRFALLAALLLLPALRASGKRAMVIGFAAAALAALGSINAARQHAAFDREAGEMDEAIAAIPRGVRVFPLVFDPRGHVLEGWPYLHAGQYAMVRRGGMTSANLGRVPVFPVRLRDLKAPHVDAFRPADFRFETMGGAYDYFLLRAAGGWERRLFPPEAVERVFARGDWVVLRRRARVL